MSELESWDYNSETHSSWIERSLSEQVDILTKYYPIGGYFKYSFDYRFTTENTIIKVNSYSLLNNDYYVIEADVLINKDGFGSNRIKIYPRKLYPHFRQNNLELLNI